MNRSQVANDPHVFPDDDGYTLTRYIQPVERMYGALRFTYRPVSSTRRAKFRDNARPNESEAEALNRVAAAVAKQVVEWNAVDIKGAKLPVSQQSVLSLHPALQQRLVSIVLWSFEGGDFDPEGEPRTELHLDPFGDCTDDAVVEDARKNS